jgi:hypothetical protein
MYFLYIYITMRKEEERLIIISYDTLTKQKSMNDAISEINKTIQSIDSIDNDSVVMDSCEHMDLKTRKNTKFKGVGSKFFQEKIYGIIVNTTGSEFLIFNN